MKKKLFILFICHFLIFTKSIAQWQQTNGPYGGKVTSLAVIGTNLFAGTDGGGVFISTNNGANWTQVNNGLTTVGTGFLLNVKALAVNGTDLYAAIYFGGVFKSTNNGGSWTPVNSGISIVLNALISSGGNLFAGTGGGVFRSTNNGNSWSTVNTGLPSGIGISALATSGSNIYAAGSGVGTGVYLSTNNGGSWTAINNGLPTASNAAISLSIAGTKLFVGFPYNGLYVSVNNGTTWTQVSGGFPTNNFNLYPYSVVANGSNLLAATSLGMYLSTNNGLTWSAVNNGLSNTSVYSLTTIGSNLFAGTAGGVFLTNNNGSNWSAVNTGLTASNINVMAVNGSDLLAGTNMDKLFLSNNNGSIWNAPSSTLNNLNVQAIALSGSNLFAGTNAGIYLSTNNGVSWTSVNNGLPLNNDVRALTVIGTNIFAATQAGGVYLSTNNGSNWVAVNNGLPIPTIIYALAASGANLFVGTQDTGVYLSTNSGSSWTRVSSGIPSSSQIRVLTVSGTSLFAGTQGGGVFRSTNNGNNWAAVNTGLGTAGTIHAFAVNGNDIYVGAVGGVFVTSDNGGSWTQVNPGLPLPTEVRALFISGNNLFAGTHGRGVWKFPIIPTKKFPSITINKSQLDTGEVLTIKGTNFSPPYAQLNLSSINGNQIATQFIAVAPDNTFAFNWIIPDSLSFGFYNLSVMDTFIKLATLPKKINIKHNGAQQTDCFISIQSPLSSDQVYAGSIIYIQWSDEMIQGDPLVTSKSGYATKTYKVEYSLNGGAWQFLANHSGIGKLYDFTTFTEVTSMTADGGYRIRVSDLNNPACNRVSSSFTVLPAPGQGFDYSMEWDNSGPIPNTNPVGICADGTARVYLNVHKKPTNSKTISEVNIIVSDPNLPVQDVQLTGKVMAATIKGNTYSTEANTASSNQATCSSPIGNEFLFWYVAPDDFDRGLTPDVDKYSGQRYVQVDITVKYTDNSQEIQKEFITVVRPPILFVHGIDGDEHAWDNFKYTNSNSIPIHFIYSYNLFAAGITTNNMLADGSYSNNALKLLDNGTNSFQKCIHTARFARLYAANRVDYVCHSMGGDMIRTAINHFPSKYFASDGTSKYENYGFGFVNKLITLNTPHNGSPMADWAAETFPKLSFFDRSILFAAYSKFDNFVWKVGPKIFGIPNYIPTDAVKDLRSFKGGIKFNTTVVKNHLIGGTVNNTSSPLKSLKSYLNQHAGSKIEELLSKCITFTSLGVDNLEDYIKNKSPYPDFFVNSDFVVPLTSEFAGNTTFGPTAPRTLFYGFDKNHMNIRDVVEVGDRVLDLLNTPINSPLFANSIPANTFNPNPDAVYKGTGAGDSVLEYFDTAKVMTQFPSLNSVYLVDSFINIKISLRDTAHLKSIFIQFQGESYSTISRGSQQIFALRVSPNFIDTQKVIVAALFDSLGFDIYHYNVTQVIVRTDSLPLSLTITPKTKVLNSHEEYIPILNGIHNSYITSIGLDNPELSVSVADTNVISFNATSHSFFAKDSGSTYVVFTYDNLQDTLFIYVHGAGDQIPNTVKYLISNANWTMHLYPNPNNGLFMLNVEGWQEGANVPVKLEVVDMTGRVVWHTETVSGSVPKWSAKINLGNIVSGVYLLHLSCRQFQSVQRFTTVK